MKTISKIIPGLAIIALIVYAGYLIHQKNLPKEAVIHPSQQISELDRNSGQLGQNSSQTVPSSALINVPFTSQSPLAQWDPDENAACEEASIIMAWHWQQGTAIQDQNQAEKEIRDMIAYEKQNYGNAVDTSAADTKKLFEDYYHNNNIALIYDQTIDDIIAEIAANHVVIVPTNGIALNNPHFKTPGPETHMLVIVGYDNNRKQFITNDPGTHYGQGYTYDYNVLYNAIRDYPTGDHLPITGNRKAMLVVSK